MREMTLERTPSTEASRRSSENGSAKYRNAIWDSGVGMAASYLSYSLDKNVGDHISPLVSEHDTGSSLLIGSYLHRYITSSHGVPGWIGYTARTDPQTFVVLIHGPAQSPAPTVGDIARGLRDCLPLPILDIATLCGVKRRQFYNLLNGESRRTEAEKHMRVLWQAVTDLDDAVSHDADDLRAALLMPVTDDYRSLFDVASEPSRRQELSDVARRLIDRLGSGDVSGLLPRPSPALRDLQTREGLEAAEQELRRSSSPLASNGD